MTCPNCGTSSSAYVVVLQAYRCTFCHAVHDTTAPEPAPGLEQPFELRTLTPDQIGQPFRHDPRRTP